MKLSNGKHFMNQLAAHKKKVIGSGIICPIDLLNLAFILSETVIRWNKAFVDFPVKKKCFEGSFESSS